MSRYKHYLDIDVVTAARQRIAHIFDVFDTVAVMFSGGKDSLVCLELCLAEAARLGRLPLDVIFLDEELLPNPIIDFIDSYRRRPSVRMHWFAVPMRNTKYVLGESEEICTWGPGRPHVRTIPPWAITLPPGDTRKFRQQDMDEFTCRAVGFKGRTTYVNGIRAAESLVRYRSVVNKLNENYICASSFNQVKLSKPIYDWLEDDIFLFLRENDIAWCSCYEAQLLSGIGLRVSTPLHGEAAKKLGRLKQADPDFYSRLLAVFPDIDNQARYFSEFDKDAVYGDYADGLDGCLRYIQQMPDAGKQAQAMKLYKDFATCHQNDPDGYPTSELLKTLVRGVVHRMWIPSGS